jgi:hypothetical protein
MNNEVFLEWDNANQELEKLADAAFIYPAFSKENGHISINLFFIDERGLNIKIPQEHRKQLEQILVALTQEIIQKVGLTVIGMVYKKEELTDKVRKMMARDAINRFKKYFEDHDLKDFIGRKFRKKLGLPVEKDKEYTIRLAWEDEEQ